MRILNIEKEVRDTVLGFFRRKGIDVCAIAIIGSFVFDVHAKDIDVIVFLCDRVSKDRLRELEAELKAVWDSRAAELGLPALDPIIVSGFKILWFRSQVVEHF